MNLALLVYSISLINGINVIAALVLALSFSIVCLYLISTNKPTYYDIKYPIRLILIFSSVLVLVPSEKTAYIMVAAYATEKIAEDPRVQEVGTKILKIINSKIDTYVTESINKEELK